jgi:hypothetical protein
VQGAELMSKFGINVPPGKAAKSLDDVKKAAESMKDENNEVLPHMVALTCLQKHGCGCVTMSHATSGSAVGAKRLCGSY